MGDFLKNIQPAVKKETKRVALSTGVCVVLMWLAFFLLHLVIPDKVPFDYRVLLGGICGGIVAVLNFFLMGLTVQKVVVTEDEEAAKAKMKASYKQRFLMQILWIVVAMIVPVFHAVAGIAPLLFPSIGIKVLGIMKK